MKGERYKFIKHDETLAEIEISPGLGLLFHITDEDTETKLRMITDKLNEQDNEITALQLLLQQYRKTNEHLVSLCAEASEKGFIPFEEFGKMGGWSLKTARTIARQMRLEGYDI